MQREAVQTAVERLEQNKQADEKGIPRGEARGRIVLPCGTGKTRIALRILEELTMPGELSVVLCPSIALVAQIRREFLQHQQQPMRMMAVCSDQEVGANDEEKIAAADDATLDRGLSTTEEIRGCPVTTDPAQIAEWIGQRRSGGNGKTLSVIFGTYHSARRISEGVKQADAADGFKLLVCDEAHRTAGIAQRRRTRGVEERLRAFTLCHNREAFPATYRVYQTATPRIYRDGMKQPRAGFLIRQMDDQEVFGVELYRRSYPEAVRNGWLSDYRIIAMAVGGREATGIANELVQEADEQAEREAAAAHGRKPKPSRRGRGRLPTTGDYLKGMAFALVMGGAAQNASGDRLPLRSCIGFLNTIARSKAMTSVLQSDTVRKWVAEQAGEPAPVYRLEHVDASASAAGRDEAKRRLTEGNANSPHGVLNVGIFGEGTDSPQLSAVAFLEPRRSPIDVVQAVGRVMRRAEGKNIGYIIVPVVIPAGVDAEQHLAVSDRHEGWRELGEILQALRAHDQRIEDALPEMMTIQLPSDPQLEVPLKTAVALGRPGNARLEYAVVTGRRDDAEEILSAAAATGRPLLDYENTEPFDESRWEKPEDEPSLLMVQTRRTDGSTETREDNPVRKKTPEPGQTLGKVQEKQTKRRARQVANGQRGRRRTPPEERARLRAEREQKRQAAYESHIQGVMVDLSGRLGGEIVMNLLEKSGLTGNKIERDLNLLEDAVGEAARHLHSENRMAAALDAYFGIDNLSAPKKGKPRADGATVAALLWMNAAMLHQRVQAGRWLGGRNISPLSEIKASPAPERMFRNSWQTITRRDFLPVIEPAMEALDAAEGAERLGGLRRALRHIAGEAEQIAQTYADMGVDHAGALFNKVMGDQASDGAFFTRPAAADIAARLTLEAVDPGNGLEWADVDVWRQWKTVDLACGSGTLLAAVMTEMKRRAAAHGADRRRLAALQKTAVEETLKGLDINPVSLQLAATQLMAGNTDIKFRRMGLHQMPYGPQPDGTCAAGTLELFGRQEIVSAGRLFDDAAESAAVRTGAEHNRLSDDPDLEDAAEAAKGARIVIMNPPFTSRVKMGEKFDEASRKHLRARMNVLERCLSDADPDLGASLHQNALEPWFTALADLSLTRSPGGCFTTVLPTSVCSTVSNLTKRLELAKRFHIHTILTSYGADINLSQGTKLNESIVVMQRRSAEGIADTRIIGLDRLPRDEHQTGCLFECLAALGGQAGIIADGWGEVSWWPAERINAGDWSAAVFRSPQIANEAARFFGSSRLTPLQETATGRRGGGRENTQDAVFHHCAGIPQDTVMVHLTRLMLSPVGYRKRHAV